MANVNPVLGGIAMTVKDVGAKLIKLTHKLNTRRVEYPVPRIANVRCYRNVVPIVEDALFIAPNAMAQGYVIMGHNASLMYHTTARNYHTVLPTRIGDNSTLLDRTSLIGQVRIGHDVLIGPGCTLDCCDVHDNIHIGAGCCIQLGCILEDGCIIAPGTNLDKDTRVNAGEFWAGNPGRCIGHVTPEQAAEAQHLVQDAIEAAKQHKDAIKALYDEVSNLDYEWLMRTCEKIEERSKSVVPVNKNPAIPLEAKRFLQPRVSARRPDMTMRVSYPVNRIAPWMPKPPDWAANV